MENNEVVNHGLNAAEQKAEDSQAKQQVEQLASQLNSNTATSSENETSSAQQ